MDTTKSLLALTQTMLFVISVWQSIGILNSDVITVYAGNGPTIFKKTLREGEEYGSVFSIDDYSVEVEHRENINSLEGSSTNLRVAVLLAVTASVTASSLILLALTTDRRILVWEISLLLAASTHAFLIVRHMTIPQLNWNEVLVEIPQTNPLKNIYSGPTERRHKIQPGKIVLFRALGGPAGQGFTFTEFVTDKENVHRDIRSFFEVAPGIDSATPVDLDVGTSRFTCRKGRKRREVWIDYIYPDQPLPCVVLLQEGINAPSVIKGYANFQEGYCERKLKARVAGMRRSGWTCQ
ncbi:MAG: hypothetical protein GY856_17380 [bacterium]|nr:hypothetical protein [bacterium]